MSPARAIARRTLADSRARTLSFALLFAGVTAMNVVGYRKTYPTLADRLSFVQSFGANKSVRLFYGVPHDLLTTGGYAAWRAGGLLTIFAAAWGLLAAVRAMRAEEDAGRQELVLAGIVGRVSAFAAALAGIAAGAAVLWLAVFLGLVATRLPPGGSAYLALAVVAVVPVFVGVGALASQVAPTRRVALGFGSGILAAAFLLRVTADTTSLGTLRWTTPFGWAEELRAFAGPRPWVLLLPAVSSVLLLSAAALIARTRDVGSGLLRDRDDARPRYRLLGSPTAQALRAERGSLVAWLLGTGAFAFVLGVIAKSVTAANLSQSLREQLRKLGAIGIATPSGYLSFTFLFFVLAISLFCCSQIAAARREEADQQLETLLALPVSRARWLAGRLLLATAAAAAISVTAGALAWAGAASQGAHVSAAGMLEAGLNCLPAALLFLGLGALAFATLPRACVGIAYGLTSLAFVWELFGALLGAPAWALGLSPFHHVGLVPAQPFRLTAAIAMLVAAAVAAVVALWAFDRRDLTGS